MYTVRILMHLNPPYCLGHPKQLYHNYVIDGNITLKYKSNSIVLGKKKTAFQHVELINKSFPQFLNMVIPVQSIVNSDSKQSGMCNSFNTMIHQRQCLEWSNEISSVY